MPDSTALAMPPARRMRVDRAQVVFVPRSCLAALERTPRLVP